MCGDDDLCGNAGGGSTRRVWVEDACGVCVVCLGVYGNCGVARSVDNAGCGCSVFVGSDVDVGFVGCFVVGVYAPVDGM